MAVNKEKSERYIVRRDIKEIFPKEFVNRDLIGKFFDYVVNNFFQNSYERYINGYIGKKTVALEEGDFYISEKNNERQIYQLTPMMVSKTSNGVDIVDYNNFIHTLKNQGCKINDQNRVLGNRYWSWCPPINVDMFLNYNFYYWIEEGPTPIEINNATNAVMDIIGKEQYSYTYIDNSNEKITIDFQSGMKIILKNDENVEYNDKEFIIEGVGKSIKLIDDSEILSSSNTNPDYYVMERGCQDGNAWSLRNRWFHRSVIMSMKNKVIYQIQDENKLFYYTDLNIQDIEDDNYVYSDAELTVKSIKYGEIRNPVYLAETIEKTYKQAKKPIICFNKDIELYNHGTYDRGYVDLFLNLPKNQIHGTTNFVYQNTQLKDGMIILLHTGDKSENDNKLYEVSGISSIGKVILQTYINGLDAFGKPIKNEGIRIRYGDYKGLYYFYNGEEWVLGQQKTNINQSPLFNLYNSEKESLDNQLIYKNSSFKGSKIFDYKTTNDISANMDSDLQKRILTSGYGNYIFENLLQMEEYDYLNYDTIEKIDGFRFYKINGEETYLNNWYYSTDKTSQYITTEFEISDEKIIEKYTNDLDEIIDYVIFDLLIEPDVSETKQNIFVYHNGSLLQKGQDYFLDKKKLCISAELNLKTNDVIYVKILKNKINELPDNYYFDLPLTLTANPLNEDIKEIKYNECFDQMKSIIENQYGFSGNAIAFNNYNNTKKDLSIGTEILQHSAPILKTMLLNSKEYTNIRTVMAYISNEYTKFKNKFRNTIENMSNIGEYNEYETVTEYIGSYEQTIIKETNVGKIIKKALDKINLGKDGLQSFYNNGVADVMIDNIDLGKCYIPATPAYLGLDLCYKPSIVTLENDQTALLCHDGSYMVLFHDYRDNALLAMETAIYNSISDKFKNNILNFNKFDYIPGKFRQTDYSLNEYREFIAPMLEKWCQQNLVDYTINDEFDYNNAFTWNWSSCSDEDGNKLNGSYKAIYMYYYDTYRPHTHPWEMLGFADKPEWWNEKYGEFPYTSANIPMWKDIENGFIAQGELYGYHNEFKRPGLVEKYLPVNSHGELLDPYQIGIAKEKPLSFEAKKEWSAGDMGKVEYIWTFTSEYRYALQTILYLMKPTEWIEKNWDTLNTEILFKDTPYEQMYNLLLGHREMPKDIIMHNEKDDESYVQKIGIQQWISDFLVKENINITKYCAEPLRNMNIQLGYKCGAYYKKNSVKVISDNYGLIPTQNYSINLYKSITSNIYRYSGVIIQKVNNGYMIDGYDIEEPYFNVRIAEYNGKKTSLEVNNKNFIYYNQWTDKIKKVKYKTIYKSIQDLYVDLNGYGKYLEDNEGWNFTSLDEDGEIIDFRKKSHEFLLWSSLNPDENSILLLNPGCTEITINHNGMIDIVGQYVNGYWSILDTAGNPIYNKNVDVYRHRNYTKIQPTEKIMTLLKLREIENEHIMLFDNETIYGNKLYDPLLCVKTQRLKIMGIIADGWDGTLFAPGYIIENDGLVENYDKLAEDIKYYFDTDDIRSFGDFGDSAKQTIGYENSTYMETLLLDDRNMFDFYKGYLREKGTKLAFGKLNRSKYIMNNNTSQIDLYENWAFKNGEFGYTYNDSTMEFIIKPEKVIQDSQIITFTTNDELEENLNSIQILWNDNNWIKKKDIKNENKFSFSKDNKCLPIGGFARLDDVNYIVADNDEYETIADKVKDGDKVWIIKAINGRDWDIVKKVKGKLVSLKVKSFFELMKFDTSVLEKGDLIYVCRMNVNKEISNINDTHNLQKIVKNIIDKNAWSVFKYRGDNGYDRVISALNGIIKQSDEKTLSVMSGLTIEFPNGYNKNNEKQYLRYVLDETKDIVVSSVMKYIGIDDNGMLWAVSNIYSKDIEPLGDEENPIKENDAWLNTTEFKMYYYHNNQWIQKNISIIGKVDVYSEESEIEVEPIYVDYEFDEKYVKFTKGIITCTLNQDKTDWLYGLSLHFENGVLPIIISKNMSNISIDESLYEENAIDKINSVFYNNSWKNSVAEDYNHYMLWSDNRNVGAWYMLKYSNAQQMNWNNGKNTVYVDEFTANILNDGHIIEIRYKGELFARYGIKGHIPTEPSANIKSFNQFLPFNLERVQEKLIDMKSIRNCYMVNNDNDKTLAKIQLFDPIQGILPNNVTKEINYISAQDPVNYFDYNEWDDSKLGYLWWDLSKVRYVDYHQGSLLYKRNNWGKQLPGSEIAIMEWTKSADLPENIVKYIVKEVYNYSTLSNEKWYYYWNKNPSEIPTNDFRQRSAFNISQIINSPQDMGIVWLAPIDLNESNYSESSLVIGNFDNIAGGKEFALQMNFMVSDEIDDHKEWVLVKENTDAEIPNYLWDKMKASLIGYDNLGQIVPDLSLSEKNKLGISIRPRQTMFNNLIEARHNFVDIINSIFASRDILTMIDVDDDNWKKIFNNKDELNIDSDYTVLSHSDLNELNDIDLVGKNVLVQSDELYNNIWTLWNVEKIGKYSLIDYQKYDMEKYWRYKDLYKDKVTELSIPNYTIKQESELSSIKSKMKDGDIVYIENNGQWILKEYKNGSFYTIGLKNGTIYLTDNLYEFMSDKSLINDKTEFIDGQTKYEYLLNEVSIVIKNILSYFEIEN